MLTHGVARSQYRLGGRSVGPAGVIYVASKHGVVALPEPRP
jgi:hypothetical protein